MKLDCHCEAATQDPCHGLPEDLNHIDATEVAVTFWDKDYGLPGTLLRKVNLTEIHMDQANEHLPFRGVLRLIPSGR